MASAVTCQVTHIAISSVSYTASQSASLSNQVNTDRPFGSTATSYRIQPRIDHLLAAERDFRRQGSLVVIIMTYGNERELCGTDRKLKYEDLLRPLRDASGSGGKLKGVPKIVLVQVRRME